MRRTHAKKSFFRVTTAAWWQRKNFVPNPKLLQHLKKG